MSNLISLASLPQEILSLIIGHIEQRPTLAILSRVCKIFNWLVLPHLYEHLVFSDASEGYGTPHLFRVAYLLLRLPQRAALVKKVTLRRSYAYEASYDRKKHTESRELWLDGPGIDDVFKSVITKHLAYPQGIDLPKKVDYEFFNEEYGEDSDLEEFFQPGEDDLNQYFRHIRESYSEAAVLALLLPELINLESMDIPFVLERRGNDDWINSSQFIMKMFSRAWALAKPVSDTSPMYFKRLKNVMLDKLTDTSDDHDPRFFIACVALPAIKCLYGSNQGAAFHEFMTASVPSYFRNLGVGQSSLELIELRESKLTSPILSLVLQAPKCLKTFIYEAGLITCVETPFSSVIAALDYQRHNIENLCLSYNLRYAFKGLETPSAMDFSQFGALRSLRVTPVHIYGNDVLQYRPRDYYDSATTPYRPESAPLTLDDIERSRHVLTRALPRKLESFEVLYCDEFLALELLENSLDQLLIRKDELFPRLKLVSIHSTETKGVFPMLPTLARFPWPPDIKFLLKVQEPARKPTDLGHDNQYERKWGWDEDVEWAECDYNYRTPIHVFYDSQKDDRTMIKQRVTQLLAEFEMYN